MSTTIAQHPSPSTVRTRSLAPGVLLLLGGVAFDAGGPTHPSDSGSGSKVSQLYEMLVDPKWYPSHALLLVAMACFAAAVILLLRDNALDAATTRVARVACVVAVVATVSMTLHLLAPLGADGLAGGDKTFVHYLMIFNETVGATWALAITALAVVGGLSGSLGNRLTLVVGLVGGLAFALASATIAFTDRFDGLFPVGSLLGIWAVLSGVLLLIRRPRHEDDDRSGQLR